MGVLEDLVAAIQANTAALNRVANIPAGAHSPTDTTQIGTAGNAASTVALTAPVAHPTAQPTAQPSVTSEQVMALIQPHIGNETIKTALGVAMRALGINNLPEVQPHQLDGLYAAFKNVLAAHLPAQPAANASII